MKCGDFTASPCEGGAGTARGARSQQPTAALGLGTPAPPADVALGSIGTGAGQKWVRCVQWAQAWETEVPGVEADVGKTHARLHNTTGATDRPW